MQPTTPQPDLHQDCLAKLNRALDLAMKTAEAASAENNHKVVIQAVREVTRIVTLINKMAPYLRQRRNQNQNPPCSLQSRAKAGRSRQRDISACERPAQTRKAEHRHRKTGNQPPEIQIPDLGPLFQPDALS